MPELEPFGRGRGPALSLVGRAAAADAGPQPKRFYSLEDLDATCEGCGRAMPTVLASERRHPTCWPEQDVLAALQPRQEPNSAPPDPGDQRGADRPGDGRSVDGNHALAVVVQEPQAGFEWDEPTTGDPAT